VSECSGNLITILVSKAASLYYVMGNLIGDQGPVLVAITKSRTLLATLSPLFTQLHPISFNNMVKAVKGESVLPFDSL
jgi:hypothetical protein